MDQSRYSLFWDSHKNNVCRGLCSLQQKEEFVDMTLAADGHFVKVHQVVIALASPYLKDILLSMDTKHPVIYLNNISYTVLTNILEYIYTGEVVIPLDTLKDVVAAGKNLCIKGIENVVLQKEEISSKVSLSETIECDAFGMVSMKQSDQEYTETDNEAIMNSSTRNVNEEMQLEYLKQHIDDDDDNPPAVQTNADPISSTQQQHSIQLVEAYSGSDVDLEKGKSVMQYTTSNQGSLQLILNRFIYYLKHTNKDGKRHWRCVNYIINRCPAIVVTNDEIVLKRYKPHNHSLHDAKILKKIKNGNVYKEVRTAVSNCEQVKKELSTKKAS